jgi:hypothetical protein
MKREIGFVSYRALRLWAAGGSMLLFGGCNAITDAQLTQILSSFVTTGLNAILTNSIATLFGNATAAPA